MQNEELIDELVAGGFSQKQAETLVDKFALYPHTHDMDEIAGLGEALDELEGDEDDDGLSDDGEIG